jgi:WD repeat-containing protein 35
MVDTLPDNHSLLPSIAQMFVTVGMCDEAVEANKKCGEIKKAIDCCVQLNQWTTAIELAKKHNVKEIDALLAKYAKHLLDKNKLFNAIELYRKASHYLEAAKLMFKIAETEAAKRTHPRRVKKLYVLAALLVEQHHEQIQMTSRGKASKSKNNAEASRALAGLLEEDSMSVNDTKFIDNAWRGAEAYHFFLLAQKQMFDGYSDAAMKTVLHLREYDDIINQADIYSLIALVSSSNRAFGVCSRAFIKLESIESCTPEQRQQYEELAMEIFTKHSPKDPKAAMAECTNCETNISEWSTVCPSCDTKFPVCVATGRPLMAYQFWMCPSCKHRAYENEITRLRTCPLCHYNV